MSQRCRASARVAVLTAAVFGLAASSFAQGQLTVIISGGFNAAYREALPEFEKSTGIAVTTTMAFSQGDGDTVAKQLARGVAADVVILAKEGLADIAADKIVAATKVDLADTPTGVSVRAGYPKPDISTVEAFKQMLHRAKIVAIPPSTVGLHLKATVSTAGHVKKWRGRPRRTTARVEGERTSRSVRSASCSTSKLRNVGTIERDSVHLGLLGAVVAGQRNLKRRKLLAYLSSDKAAAAIKKSGWSRCGAVIDGLLSVSNLASGGSVREQPPGRSPKARHGSRLRARRGALLGHRERH